MFAKRLPPDAVWVFAFALIVRLIVLSHFGHSAYFSPTSSDMGFYAEWGRRIAAGHGAEPHAYYGLPGYAFLLGGVFRFAGFSPYTIAFLQTLSEAGIAALLYQIAAWAFPGPRARVTGALAALGWIFFQPAQAFSLVCMPSTWAVLAFWSVFAWSVRTGSRSLWLPWLWIGALAGLAATLVATVLLVLPVAVAAAVRNLRKPALVVAAAASLLAGVAIGTAPCWVHNAFIAREPVFLSAHGGVNFWIGNHPGATGYPSMPPGLRATQGELLKDSIRVAEAEAGRPLTRVEVSRHWSFKARAYICEHPLQWAALMGVKVRNLVNATQYDDLSLVNPLREEGVLTPGLRFGLAALLAIPGVALSWRRFPRSRWIVAGVALALAAVLPVFVTERYRLAAVPGLLLLGAAGLAELGNALASFQWRAAALWLGAAAAGACVVCWPVDEPVLLWMDTYNSGLKALETGDLPAARARLERAYAYAPGNPEVLSALGHYALRTGNRAQAKIFYRRALEANPATVPALNNLAIIAMSEGQWAAAQNLLTAARRIDPDDAGMRALSDRCASELARQPRPAPSPAP
ncbi:MAG: tetratricopeptide repeat protein [Chthoniobacteraceae bacterium]|nr:tetratricopeptide repeat protein [Chthoniobacteraceae bacterium]